MQTRNPVVAGRFYPGREKSCLTEVKQLLAAAEPFDSLPETVVAGIVPHAGWTFSADLAAKVFAAIRKCNRQVDTFVIFGAAHSFSGPLPAVYDSGTWLTPLGELAIDEDLAQAVLKTETAVRNTTAHQSEHSIEVQTPFIQHLYPNAKIVPIVVPPTEHALLLGETVAELINAAGEKKIVCIGSTDLTHYGPGYGFTPMGVGPEACRWASNVNDKQFIGLALELEPRAMLTNAAERHNACGPGAAAAAVAVAKKLGSKRGFLLGHTNSSDVMQREMQTTSDESVGYAAIVF